MVWLLYTWSVFKVCFWSEFLFMQPPFTPDNRTLQSLLESFCKQKSSIQNDLQTLVHLEFVQNINKNVLNTNRQYLKGFVTRYFHQRSLFSALFFWNSICAENVCLFICNFIRKHIQNTDILSHGCPSLFS